MSVTQVIELVIRGFIENRLSHLQKWLRMVYWASVKCDCPATFLLEEL